MSQTNTVQNQDVATLRLPFREKVAYGMGDLGSNILLDIGTLYLLKFYTDVLGLPGTYGGIIFLIAKFFTAFTDMGTGIMLDSRRRIGPKGKFRPFVLYAAFPVTLLAIANFVGTPFEITGKAVMATVLFMLYGLFFSMMNCSYGAMVPAITKNPDERASLAAWRQGGATLGLLLCTVGFVPVMNLIEGNPQLSYIFAATLFSLFGLLFMWWCYAGTRERYVEAPAARAAHKPGLLQSFRAIAGNRPLFVLCIANLCTLGAFNIKLAIQVYYTQYVLNDPILLSYMGFFSMGCIFIGVFLMPGAVRRFGKKKIYIGGLLIWAAGGGRRAQLRLRQRFGELCGVLVSRVFRLRVCKQPQLGAGFRHGRVWRMAHRRALRGHGLHRLHLLSQSLPGAGRLFSRPDADANRLCAERRTVGRYDRRPARADFHLAVRAGCGDDRRDGLFLQP